MRAETVDVPPDALTPALAGRVKTVYEFDPGFDVAESLKARRVQGLEGGGPAARAGLRAGDKLVGWTVHGDADKRMVLQVERRGEVKEIRYFPRGKGVELLQFEEK
jgi:predicted metalloprotease with PDZ domain